MLLITATISAITTGAVLALIIALTFYHQISLKAEFSRIKPNGKLFNIEGSNIHVYSEGVNSGAPTLVFLSGAGTSAPVYDFKPLYSLLSGKYRIAVVERLGYGYSDFSDSSRGIATVLAQTREALTQAGIRPPYVLIPHSMSGLEAIYWAVKHPDEIASIIGLDMATPGYCLDESYPMPPVGLLSIAAFAGFQRIPFFYPISSQSLSEDEYQQAKYLSYRNAVNRVVVNEYKCLRQNAKIAAEAGSPNVPFVMFYSNGGGLGEAWARLQEAYAKEANAELIKCDCGHYIHQFEPEKIAEKICAFLSLSLGGLSKATP